MLISFDCPYCDSELEVDADEAGTRVDCPACSQQVRAPLPRLGPGTTLGHFFIERKIGRGGMGEVFLARQLSMDRMVALKVLPQALTRNPRVVDRFLHEVRMSARLEHPNVITAFEAGEDFGYHFLAMSFVDGEDLGSRLKRDGALPEKEALTYTRHVSEALCYAWNTYRMLHRDIKPSNIMVDKKGIARIMDLGISKSLEDDETAEEMLTVSGMLVGTPHYMSPEATKSGADVDCRADIYSLGATLYHLLTGQTIHHGKTTIEVIRQIGIEPVPPVRKVNSAVSEHCARLVEKMIAVEADLRHPRWESVITDIDRVLAGRDPLLPVGEARRSPQHEEKPTPGPNDQDTPTEPDKENPADEPHADGETSENSDPAATSEPKQPPRIDMHKRRVRWVAKQYLRRTILLLILLVVVAGSAVVVRKTRLSSMLRDALVRVLSEPEPATNAADDYHRRKVSEPEVGPPETPR